jgi:hypothetical protein
MSCSLYIPSRFSIIEPDEPISVGKAILIEPGFVMLAARIVALHVLLYLSFLSRFIMRFGNGCVTTVYHDGKND